MGVLNSIPPRWYNNGGKSVYILAGAVVDKAECDALEGILEAGWNTVPLTWKLHQRVQVSERLDEPSRGTCRSEISQSRRTRSAKSVNLSESLVGRPDLKHVEATRGRLRWHYGFCRATAPTRGTRRGDGAGSLELEV
nr:hypothetical protein CFP56_32364 [Quercus suber]